MPRERPRPTACEQRADGASLCDDLHRDLRVHATEQTHRHVVRARLLQVLIEVDLTAIDLEALLGQLLGDVAAGDRAVEQALLADPRTDDDARAVQARGE